MPQLADYRTAVRAMGFDGLTDALVDSAINDARRRVLMDRRWSWLEATDSLVTVAGVPNVALSGIAPLDLLYIDAVRLRTVATDPIPLAWRTRQIIRDLQDRDPQTGEPEFWTRIENGIVFWPTPDIAYPVTVEFIVDATATLAPAVDDIIPDRHIDLVKWAACVPLKYRQENYAGSSAADQYYSRVLLPRHFAQDNTEQRQTSHQMRTGYWGVR